MSSQNAFLSKYANKHYNEYQDEEFFILRDQIHTLINSITKYSLLPVTGALGLLYEYNTALPPFMFKKNIGYALTLYTQLIELEDLSNKLYSLNISEKQVDYRNTLLDAVNKFFQKIETSNPFFYTHFIGLRRIIIDELLESGAKEIKNIELRDTIYDRYTGNNAITLLPELHDIEHSEVDVNISFNADDCRGFFELYSMNVNLSVLYLMETGIIFQEFLFGIFEDIRKCDPLSPLKPIGPLENTLTFTKIFEIIIEKAIGILNDELELDIHLTFLDIFNMSEDEFNGLNELWTNLIKERIDSGEYIVFKPDMTLPEIMTQFILHSEIEEQEEEIEEYQEPQADSKASSAILKFFDSNSNTLVAKLKDSGLQLSAAALQNDQNIARVANVVYNLLPGMVRIFVSYDTVENFLLNNRQWLINKLV